MHPFSALTIGIFVAGYTTARWDLVTRLYELAIFAWDYGVVVSLARRPHLVSQHAQPAHLECLLKIPATERVTVADLSLYPRHSRAPHTVLSYCRCSSSSSSYLWHVLQSENQTWYDHSSGLWSSSSRPSRYAPLTYPEASSVHWFRHICTGAAETERVVLES